MTVGDRIRQRRRALGMSADELGEQIGKNRATIYRYEKGDIENVPTPIIKDLAEALQTSIEYLMGWDGLTKTAGKAAFAATGTVPVMDGIAAGAPILARENIVDYMPVTTKNPEEYFALIVRGDSMIGAGIPDGCKVLIHIQPTAENGQIVACRVNGDEATLKRFKQRGETVFLLPENPDYEPYIVPVVDFENGEAEILGVVKQIIIDVR